MCRNVLLGHSEVWQMNGGTNESMEATQTTLKQNESMRGHSNISVTEMEEFRHVLVIVCLSGSHKYTLSFTAV